MIWETDEACVEAREAILDEVYGKGNTLGGKSVGLRADAYARAVAVAVLKEADCSTPHCGTEGWALCKKHRMLAEFGGAE